MIEESRIRVRFVLYWCAAAIWFAVAFLLAWGSTPIALILWSIGAIPLALKTYDLLVEGGRSMPRWLVGVAGGVWIGFGLLAAALTLADAALAPYENAVHWSAGVFVLMVTTWGFWVSTRPKLARGRLVA